jgi:penicillin-binding protein 1A
MDQAVTIKVPGGSEIWQPRDVSPPSNTPMTLRQGLAYSKNTITAQLMEMVGPVRVVQLAQSLGVRASKLEPVLSLALGTSPVTLREMVTAYSAIASGGQYIEPMVIMRVEDRKGDVLVKFETKRESADALPRQKALELVDMMRGVIDQGTGAGIRSRYGITADVAGKTGTTQENTDGWFLMMHPHLVAGARVGFNSTLTMGNWGQGARSALPIVGEVFQAALRVKAIDANAEFAIARKKPEAPQPELLSDPMPEGDLGTLTPGQQQMPNDLMPQVQGLPPPQPQPQGLPPEKGLILPPPKPDPQPQPPRADLPPPKGLILPPPKPDPQPQPRPADPPAPASSAPPG